MAGCSVRYPEVDKRASPTIYGVTVVHRTTVEGDVIAYNQVIASAVRVAQHCSYAIVAKVGIVADCYPAFGIAATSRITSYEQVKASG